MRKITALSVIALFVIAGLIIKMSETSRQAGESVQEEPMPSDQQNYREISGNIRKGETFFHIFKRYGLSMAELFSLKEASAAVHRLRELSPGQPYRILVDDENRVNSFSYRIDDDSFLDIMRSDDGFYAEKKVIQYEKRIRHMSGVIRDNLISSVGEGKENLLLAFSLSDIFAWDIDFTTDLRNGDTFKIVVEGNYLDGEFRKFGNILSAEFRNNGETYRAYRFDHDGITDYYDERGRSLRKAFLKAPLDFRRISSGFSRARMHPILKRYRPHNGIDYSAPVWTPVSASGNGTVKYAGYKGGYGKLIVIEHRNGYSTYYGHLSKYEQGIKKGVKVNQGQLIGYVGTSGLATGPHLHYEMRVNNKPINPLKADIPRGESVPKKLMEAFRSTKTQMDERLASIEVPVYVLAGKKGTDTAVNKY